MATYRTESVLFHTVHRTRFYGDSGGYTLSCHYIKYCIILGLTSGEDPDLTEPPSCIDDDSFGTLLPEQISADILSEKLLGVF